MPNRIMTNKQYITRPVRPKINWEAQTNVRIEKTSRPNDNGAKYSQDSSHKNENPVTTNQQLEIYSLHTKNLGKIWLNSRTNELKTEKIYTQWILARDNWNQNQWIRKVKIV